MNEVILTEQLTKHYGNVTAVKDLNLSIGKSEIYGFLGLNGAGKTTTIRMLLGMIKPSSGNCFLNGVKVGGEHADKSTQVWNQVGSLVEIPYAYPDLTVKENLEIFRRMRFIPDTDAVKKVIDKLGLTQYAERKARHLSLGNAQRLGLAKALIHNPQILILDEPSNGLDPAGIHEIRELLLDLAENQGVTIFISSHILGEISRFATRIGIIHNGELIKEINSEELEKLCRRQLIVDTVDNVNAFKIFKDSGITAEIGKSDKIISDDIRFIEHPEKISDLLTSKGISLKMLNVVDEDLESYFLRTIQEKGGLK
jgi:ABC-2 type transport system ATP-binding protein